MLARLHNAIQPRVYFSTAKQVARLNILCQYATGKIYKVPPESCRVRFFSRETFPPEIATKKWVDNIVIGMKLCPWAKSVREQNKLRFSISQARTIESLLQDASHEIYLLEQSLLPGTPKDFPETTLLVIDNNAADASAAAHSTKFLGDFRSFTHASWEIQGLIQERGLVGQLQLVLFHPEAKHSMYSEQGLDDAADYTIRSPLPTFHFLREKDILEAVERHSAAATIPDVNRQRLRATGVEAARLALSRCHMSPTSSS